MGLRRPDPAVQRLLAEQGGTQPSETIQRLCLELLDEAGVDQPPVDLRMLASYRGVRTVTEVDSAEAGCIFWDGSELRIQVRSSDSPRRQRVPPQWGTAPTRLR